MYLNSLNIVKNILPQHSRKCYSLHKFSSKLASGCSKKKHLRSTISRRLRTAFLKHLESKCLYISAYLCKRPRKLLFGWGLNNFLNPDKAGLFEGSFLRSQKISISLSLSLENTILEKPQGCPIDHPPPYPPPRPLAGFLIKEVTIS